MDAPHPASATIPGAPDGTATGKQPTAFQAEYARRAGIEGTLSRETRSMRLRRTRLPRPQAGAPGTHLSRRGAENVVRLGEWFLETSRAKTRITPFARLMADGAAA